MTPRPHNSPLATTMTSEQDAHRPPMQSAAPAAHSGGYAAQSGGYAAVPGTGIPGTEIPGTHVASSANLPQVTVKSKSRTTMIIALTCVVVAIAGSISVVSRCP